MLIFTDLRLAGSRVQQWTEFVVVRTLGDHFSRVKSLPCLTHCSLKMNFCLETLRCIDYIGYHYSLTLHTSLHTFCVCCRVGNVPLFLTITDIRPNAGQFTDPVAAAR